MFFRKILLCSSLIVILAGCLKVETFTPPTLTQTPSSTITEIVIEKPSDTPTSTELASATQQPEGTPLPSTTVRPKFTPTHTEPPPDLLGFTTKNLREGISPQKYIIDPCVYLENRWSVDSSVPGTVVIPIMFHGIRKSGGLIEDNVTISEEDFAGFVLYAESLGYETITSEQLERFLLFNDRIPPLSMIWIIDDRRPGTVEEHILPVLERNGWTATLGWVSGDNNPQLWQWMESLYASGKLDVQAHGYEHRYLVWDTPEDVVREEIELPLGLIEDHFGIKPFVFIWPGGNFTPVSVQIARQVGYRLGFTIQSNGPLMYNWIPLGEKEQGMQDPLMVLPRFWSTALGVSLDTGVLISNQARQDAISRYEVEAAYYRIFCEGELPAVGDIFPETLSP